MAEKGNGNGGRRPDSQQLARQWAILRLLANSGRSFSVRELAEQFNVSKTTIQRDLATLEQEFALVEEQINKQKKVYRIDQTIRALETITFGPCELLALHAAESAMRGLTPTPLHEDLRRVVHKIRGFLSPRHNGGLDDIARVFQAHSRGFVDYNDQREIIDELGDAIARRRGCRVRYHARWKGTTREHQIKPLKLVSHRSALYLFAQVAGRDEITTFAVHRIEDLESTGETFSPPRVDVAAHATRAFGIFISDDEEDVEILFDPQIAWRIEERIYHPDETKERLDDGRLRYCVRTSAQWEIIPWVQGFGPLAELVAPESWRQTLIESARGLLELYG